MKHLRIIEEISRHLWAVSQPAIEAIVRIVSEGEQLEPRSIFHGSETTVEWRKEEIAAVAGNPTPEAYKFGERHGKMGILHVDGPLIPRAGMNPVSQPALTTTYGLVEDLMKMEASADIDRIVLMIDSPGGAVTGISELAAQISESKKPVVAYVEGLGASAAYWIASACDAVVVANTANVGGIGVVAKVAAGKDKNSVEVISSQSPSKHADPATEEGRKGYQSMVDDMADVFINTVADNRNTSREDVLENFGKGGVVIASRAKAKGMIDAVLTRKKFLSDFSGDLQAGCPWLKGGKSKKGKGFGAFASEKIDNLENRVELEGETTAQGDAVEKQEGIKNMTLKEFLEANPAAKAELDGIVAESIKTASEALRSTLTTAAKVAASSDYPDTVRGIASDVIQGKRTKEALEAVMAVAEMEAERIKSADAKNRTESIGATPAQSVSTRSTDGKIRTQADIEAVLNKERK